MKLNGKLKIDNEVEKALRKSKNKGKHVKIVAEPTKREKQILRGEKPENYVDYKASPMALVIQLSRQAKLAKINEEYNKQMSMENDKLKANLKLNLRNNEKEKKYDYKIRKINKEENDKEMLKNNNKINVKNGIKEKNIRIKIIDNNNGKIENRSNFENKNYNRGQRSNYREKINTESNNDIYKSPKVNEKKTIKYKKPFLGEMLDINQIFDFKKPILTEKSELTLEKKGDTMSVSNEKRLFGIDKTHYYNRKENKSTVKKQIERLRNNDKNIKVNSFIKSASNLKNIIKEDKNRTNNKTLIIEKLNNKINNSNNNEKNPKVYNRKINRDSNINRSHKILLLNNNRSSNNLFNNFNSGNKKDEIKRTDTKVLYKQRPEIVSESVKSFNDCNIKSNQDTNNSQRKINSRNDLRNYKNNYIENNKNENKKGKEKLKPDDNNNNLENFDSKRRKYGIYTKDEIENNSTKNILKEENKEITISRRGTRSNRNNIIISKYSISYDNSNVYRKEKLEENSNISYKNSEKKDARGNLNKTGHQTIHKDNNIKIEQTINNDNNNINNNKTFNNRGLREIHNIEDKGKNIIIPLNRKYFNHSFDFSKRNINENDNKKSINENIINMKEEKTISGRYSNFKNLKVKNLFENNYHLFNKNYVLENEEERKREKKDKNIRSPNNKFERI